MLPKNDKNSVYIFSTMFYKQMASSYNRDETGTSSSEKKLLRVKGWTKHVNLIEEELIIFPICESGQF